MSNKTANYIWGLFLVSILVGTFTFLMVASIIIIFFNESFDIILTWAMLIASSSALATFLILLDKEYKIETRSKTQTQPKQITKLGFYIDDPTHLYPRGIWAELKNISQEEIEKMAEMLLKDSSFGVRRFISSGVFLPNQYYTMRNFLLEHHFICWKNRRAVQQGLMLTPIGRKAMQEIVSSKIKNT